MFKYRPLTDKQLQFVDFVFLSGGSWVSALMGALLFCTGNYIDSVMLFAVYVFIFMRYSVVHKMTGKKHGKAIAMLSVSAGLTAIIIVAASASYKYA
jgi:hypothetical protein